MITDEDVKLNIERKFGSGANFCKKKGFQTRGNYKRHRKKIVKRVNLLKDDLKEVGFELIINNTYGNDKSN